MKLIINVPEILISPFMKIVLRYRKIRFGYPFRRIPLTEGKFAIVDPEDFKELNKYSWYLNHNGYACINVGIGRNGKPASMHRKIMRPGQGLIVDHINHEQLDNRKINLRVGTKRQNNCNRRHKPHSSRFRGVSLRKNNKWKASIKADKTVHLGYFHDEVEAAKAYDRAARKYHGEFASLNFPEEALSLSDISG